MRCGKGSSARILEPRHAGVSSFPAQMSRAGHDIVLWTSAADSYVSGLVNEIDPKRTRFLDVLTREACVDLRNGSFTKDLSILGRPLERMVLIDDSVASFLKQPDNAIPINPWFGDAQDRALPLLIPMLRGLERVTDVRDNLRTSYNVRKELQTLLHRMQE